MGNKTLVYKEKLKLNLNESFKHLKRLNDAFDELLKRFDFPIDSEDFKNIVGNLNDLAFCDQIIYRFSKLQDSMGAKLFRSVLLYEGETVDRPFLDILNLLEKMGIINVDEWFEIRDLRNEISHEYDDNEQKAMEIINMIYERRRDLEYILNMINDLVKDEK